MLELLVKHAVSNFHFVFTGDESWLLSAYHVRTMSTLCPENVDQTERPSHRALKTMLTVFSTAMVCISLPFCLRIERRTQNALPRTLCHHGFLFAPGTRGHIEHATMLCILITHRSTTRNFSPRVPIDGLATCVFLFWYLKDKLIDTAYRNRTPEEPFNEVETVISKNPNNVISKVFLPWQERLPKCIEMQGNYVEQRLHFH
jgi:hypothetical protein